MKEIIIAFPKVSKQFQYKHSNELELKVGDRVLVENNQVIEVGEVIDLKNEDKVNLEIGEGKILRKLDKKDEEKIIENKQKAKEYLLECKKVVDKSGLVMKIIDAEISHDEKKLTIYFGAEGRIDFRNLLSDLVRKYKKLIRLQQIGTRDEAKILGGIGKCGRKVCCGSFLKNIDSITLDMAKEQNLSSGANKISGLCGKLMCCLDYELDTYRKLKKKLPPIGDKINTPSGKGKVIEHHILKTAVIVELDGGERIKVEL